MTVVCLDTQIIQWSLMRRASDVASHELVEKAVRFGRWLDQQGVDVVIPTVVIGELLVPIPQHEHEGMLAKITEKWIVVDYDLMSARRFAVMRYDKAIVEIMADIRAHNPYATRRQLIADVMIIATAIVNRATILYSHDNDFLKLARGYIESQNFLDVPIQPGFPEDEA